MPNLRKTISIYLTTSLLAMATPLAADDSDFEDAPPGVAYMDQAELLPSACTLLFIMAIGAGVGAWLLLRNSSGHNNHTGPS